mmetsp:Transcript_20371/g.51296  ORF Transcript_20371/g.51296 Transcript_20371/m.51296 type:complete len:128 (-) Transcript_20371:141-524(-)|eukprot:jgi/Tetstr1/466630/TSEL_011118.t1
MAASTTPTVFNVDVNPPVVASEFKVEDTKNSVEISGDMKDNAISNVKLGLTQDRILTIVGEQTVVAEQTGEQADAGQKQVPYQRAMPLPPVVNESNITAKMTQEGELKLSMPKHAAASTDAEGVSAC